VSIAWYLHTCPRALCALWRRVYISGNARLPALTCINHLQTIFLKYYHWMYTKVYAKRTHMSIGGIRCSNRAVTSTIMNSNRTFTTNKLQYLLWKISRYIHYKCNMHPCSEAHSRLNSSTYVQTLHINYMTINADMCHWKYRYFCAFVSKLSVGQGRPWIFCWKISSYAVARGECFGCWSNFLLWAS